MAEQIHGRSGTLASRSMVPPASASFLQRLSGGKELWALSDQALVSGANFLTNILLARALGLQGFGVFAICWMVVLLMSNLQVALIVSPMMSIGPKQDQASRPSYFGTITVQALCLSVISALCVYLGTLVSSHLAPLWHVGPLAWPFAMVTAAYLLQDYMRRYFFAIGRNRLACACDALSYLTQLPLLWWMGSHKTLTCSRAFWIIGATSLFSTVVSASWREKLAFSRPMFAVVAKRHWNMVRWLAPSAVLQWTSLNIVTVSAPLYFGAQAAGALRACQNVVAVAHIWFLGLDNVIPAEAARELHERGVDASTRYMGRMFVKWGLVTLGFMMVMSIAPSFWLHLLYGARYAQFGYVLRLYGVLYVVMFVGVPLRAGLQAIEFTAPLLWSYAAITLLAAIIAAPLARRLGLAGVMTGLIATQLLFQAIVAIAFLLRCHRMRIQENLVFASVFLDRTRP